MAELLAGIELQLQDGTKVQAGDFLQGKLVALYFSAGWCPPCRHFTPILKELYDKLKESNKPFEIVFISSDDAEDAFWEYYHEHHGDWAIVPFGSEKIEEIGEKYGVKGIPTLIVIKPDGTVISDNGREDVDEKGEEAESLFNEWNEKM